MKIKGPWSRAQIDDYLTEMVVPVRLAALDGSGWPLVLSLWFRWRDGALWCATSPESSIVKLLRRDGRCGFEVAADAPPSAAEGALAAAHGMGSEQVLEAMTAGAARILGVDDRVGSLEVGKDGDLALYDGDPLEYTTHCVGVVIEGEIVHDEPR